MRSLGALDHGRSTYGGGALGAQKSSITLLAGSAVDDLPPELQMILTESSPIEPRRYPPSRAQTPLDPLSSLWLAQGRPFSGATTSRHGSSDHLFSLVTSIGLGGRPIAVLDWYTKVEETWNSTQPVIAIIQSLFLSTPCRGELPNHRPRLRLLVCQITSALLQLQLSTIASRLVMRVCMHAQVTPPTNLPLWKPHRATVTPTVNIFGSDRYTHVNPILRPRSKGRRNPRSRC